MNAKIYIEEFRKEHIMIIEEKANLCCDSVHVHVDALKRIELELPPDEKLYDLADFFKIFSDSTRIKILYALFNAGEMCVCDISYVLGKTQSAISHQLRILRQAKLVKFRKEGKVVFYSLNDEHVKEILDVGYSHIKEE